MAPAALRTFFTSLALCATLGFAAPKHALDQSRIRANYHDGEFEKVIKELGAFIKSGRTCSPSESLFVEKHLAVVYAANPGTRERGRYHMFRLLDKEGGSDLLDMFVGDEVDAVFAKVLKEHSLRTDAKRKERKPAKAAAPLARIPEAKKPAPAATAKSAQARQAKAASPVRAASPTALSLDDAWAAAYLPTTVPRNATRAVVAADRVRPSAASTSVSDRDSASISPAWKEPGLWIGGSAALAVVAFTLFYSGSENATPGKTYVVPATAAK